jgi:AcrR family transcriptional regulator
MLLWSAVMREWIPVPGTSKARLVNTALEQFGARGYEAVGVTELAATAGVTTGSLYHHFGSKLGLYAVVREEAERRVLDRMEGAAAARADEEASAIVRTALLVGFDYVAGQRLAGLLAEPHPQPAPDPVESFLDRLTGREQAPVGRLLAAAWRAALAALADGVPPDRARAALAAVGFDAEPPARDRRARLAPSGDAPSDLP